MEDQIRLMHCVSAIAVVGEAPVWLAVGTPYGHVIAIWDPNSDVGSTSNLENDTFSHAHHIPHDCHVTQYSDV